MRLDRGRPEIQSKSYSNWLLIDFFDPNLARSNLLSRRFRFKFGPRLIENGRFVSKISRFHQKFVDFEPKLPIFDEIDKFLI